MMRNDDGLDHEVVGTMMMMSGGGGGGGGGQRKGGGVVVQQVVGAGGLKKGPWTAAEDAVLVEYVKKNGEGNWNSVQRNSGLLRCGKSCRLRWANHLRPNLKKGAFTPEEERVIIELHAKYGNKWARMATQLPGRTDNEIKNYWNTRMKRRQRAGLPVYPREFQDQTRSFHNMQHHLEQNTLSNRRINNNNTTKSPSLFSVFRKTPNYTSTFSFSDDGLSNFSSPPSSCFQGHNSNNANHLSSSVLYSNNINPSHHHYFNSQNGTVLSPLSPSPLVSQFPPPSAAPPVTGGENIPSNVMTFTSLIMGDYDENDVDQLESFTFGSTSELPSLQTPPRSVSSNAAGGVCVVAEGSDNANSNNNNNNARMTNRNDEDTLAGNGGGVNLVIENNSGLLDMLLMESKAMCRKRKAEELLETGVISSTASDEDGKADAAGAKRNCSDDDGGRQPHDNLVFSLSPAVMEAAEEETAAEMVSSMDDDLLSLLTNFPCSIPLPEWYRDHTDTTAHNTHNVNVKAPATATAADCYGGGVNGSPAHDQGSP